MELEQLNKCLVNIVGTGEMMRKHLVIRSHSAEYASMRLQGPPLLTFINFNPSMDE